jgi:hypothetical protein
MDISRAEKIGELRKATAALSKTVDAKGSAKVSAPKLLSSKPIGGPPPIPPPIEGSGALRTLMYVIATLLAIALVLLAVDQWITPIFKRTPGGKGFILIPGNDTSEIFWTTTTDTPELMVIKDITVGLPPISPSIKTLSTTTLEGQTTYSLSMDVYVSDEFAQNLGGTNTKRIFFLIGTTVSTPKLQVSLANGVNTVYITALDAASLQESITIDNVPMYAPFRIGIVKTPLAMEGYLNGKLVMTRQIKSSSSTSPATGDKIFAPSSINEIANGVTTNLATGIKVMNLRIFGSAITPSEMEARMTDLTPVTTFNPNSTSSIQNTSVTSRLASWANMFFLGYKQ